MARLHKAKGGWLALLAVGLAAEATPACGGKSNDSTQPGATLTAVGGSSAGSVPPAGATSMGGTAGLAGNSAQAAGRSGQVGGASSGGGIGGNAAVGGSPSSGGSDGQAIDCSRVGCAAAPWCGEDCQSVCGCCSCLEGEVDADGNRCQDGCWLATAVDAHCQEPWDGGPCEAAILAYWFNAATNRCEPRIYGGCQGNANRFETLSGCEQDCARVNVAGSEPLPVVYEFGDPCHGQTLTEAHRQIVAEFVATQAHDPPGDDPYIRVEMMAGNDLCSRSTNVVVTGTGVEAFVDYVEYGAMGFLPLHQAQIPKDAITADLTQLSIALGVEPGQVDWR